MNKDVDKWNSAKGALRAFRRMRSMAKPMAGPFTAEFEAMEVELALLREENARLRVERERVPNAGDIVERLQNLSASSRDREALGDDAWHLMAEALVMRDILIDVCQGISQAMTTVESQLHSIEPDLRAIGLEPRGAVALNGNGSAATNGNGFVAGGSSGSAASSNGHGEPRQVRWPGDNGNHASGNTDLSSSTLERIGEAK